MIRKLLIEELTREDKKFIEDAIEDAIEDNLDSSDNEDKIKEVTTEVIEDLFRVLWQRRGSWRGGLK